MSIAKYCRPSDILTDIPGGSVSLTAGIADVNFPLTNLYDRKAHTVFKSTGTGATIRRVFSSAKTLQAIGIINHKLAGATVTLTNGAGLNVSIAIPANSEDGHCIDAWKTLVGLANTSSTTWDLTITGAATVVAIGELLLVETLRDLDIGWRPELPEAHPAIIHTTSYGVRNKYGMGVRQRGMRGQVVLYDSEVAALLSLQRDARGPLKPFLLIPDATQNDALFVDLETDVRTLIREGPNRNDIDVSFIEQQKGLAL